MSLSPFERAQLVMVARSEGGEILPRATVANAMGGDEAAQANRLLARMRTCILDGRPSIFVGRCEAQALLDRNPEPPEPPGPAATAYALLMRLYRQADKAAQALDGPDPQARQAMDRIAIELLNGALEVGGAVPVVVGVDHAREPGITVRHPSPGCPSITVAAAA